MPAPGGRITIGDRLREARRRLRRVEPTELAAAVADGAFVVDVRAEYHTRDEGYLPFGVVVPRSVLEWRLDPASGATMTGGPALDQVVVVVCSDGYSSSLAACDLQAIGFGAATDLAGGFRAYAAAGLTVRREPPRWVP